MNDSSVYRWTGASAVASIAVFLFEFPFYLVRGQFPGVTEPAKLAQFTARNATNIMVCVFLDFIILGLVMVFAAGLRHLIRRADPQQEWLATLFFGVTIVYVVLTLIADSLQAATVVDALTVPADGVIMRTMTESMYLMYGAAALFQMALMMGIAGYAGVASGALPKWSGWVAYTCALACLAFVPTMFVGHPNPSAFYNPAGWGPLAIASGLPLAVWMVTVGVLMVRMHEPVAPRIPVPV